MNPRTIKNLRLPLLLLVLAFVVSLLPGAVGVADAAGCNMPCWQANCPDIYFSCIDEGRPQAACCQSGNACARFCGSGCPLFCPA
ncbi:MAG TPA: hypothetical protein VF173_34995 [Thermoanaerobaculia bacterium]|nr:hypothetical protein [Thermoanaerobaculia bacterium]